LPLVPCEQDTPVSAILETPVPCEQQTPVSACVPGPSFQQGRGIQTGEWVAVIYGSQWYPGNI